MTTKELLFEWLENYEKERIKARTYSRYQGLIELQIVPVLGEFEIKAISRRQLQEFLWQKKNKSKLTILFLR